MSLSNYGYGLTDHSPNTPWNEPEVPEKEFDVTVSQTLSKSTTICTQDYLPCVENEWNDGIGIHEEYADTSGTDWKKAYTDCAMTPLSIIKACKVLAQHLIDQGTTYIGPYHMRELIEECEDWVEDEMEVMED